MAMTECRRMRLFLIEAYGGPKPTDGRIEHFTVRAADLDRAIALVRRSPDGARYARFELIEESAEFAGREPAIIHAGDDAYL
jgi:hypothetical protein